MFYRQSNFWIATIQGSVRSAKTAINAACRALAIPDAEPDMLVIETTYVRTRNHITGCYGALVDLSHIGLCGCAWTSCARPCLRKDAKLALREQLPCDGSRYFISAE